MKKIGTVSYNIYCNFTNYGSALQTWALHHAIKKLGYQPVLVDYCPDILAEKNPLNPFRNMWDQDEESRRMCELSLPDIRVNYEKFDCFYRERFCRTTQKYTSSNFSDIVQCESLDGFVCGSDTIFCIDEFKGFDDGYYANYPEMRGKAVAYAASFGDTVFDETTEPILKNRLDNFLAVGLRENRLLDYVRERTNIPVQQTIDPTLLLTSADYDTLAAERLVNEPYLLLYTRRYNPNMEEYAERLAKRSGLRVVEISLRATNAGIGHVMRYDAGVEEFLSLVKHSSAVVTNSFHGLIFAVQYNKPLSVFIREQAGTKISELMHLFGLQNNCLITGQETVDVIDYRNVYLRIEEKRATSMAFLKKELEMLSCI